VTRQDILDAVDARHGPVIQHRIVALRSLFRALRQERIIFRDPTRGISLPAAARLPQPLPADRVAGLLDRASGPLARLAVALVAIHAVTETDLIRLQAADLDLASGTLTTWRGLQRRIIYLDEITAALASQWLRHRHQRWPGDPDAANWAAGRATAILDGKAAQVATGIRRRATTYGYSEQERKGADTCAAYLDAKASYLDYPAALANGWPIATGIIEGACRHIIKDRFDITGARWGLGGAEAILKLRALHANGDFGQYWPWHLRRERQRIYGLAA
jgi:hypothetical protein